MGIMRKRTGHTVELQDGQGMHGNPQELRCEWQTWRTRELWLTMDRKRIGAEAKGLKCPNKI